ncbi:MAG: response regulator [Cyanobacteria bacterium J06636_16]
MKLTELAALLEPPSKSFDGHLVIGESKTTWTLSFVQGQLLYAVDDLHAVRRWERLIKQHFPNWNWRADMTHMVDHQPWQLGLLNKSIEQKQLSLIRAKLVIRAIAKECLFELSYLPNLDSRWKPTSFSLSPTCRNLALSGWEIRMTLNKVETMRQQWYQAGLELLSPSLAPMIRKSVKSQFLPIAHQYLVGEHTLWDIADQLDRSPVEVAQSLLPYVENGILGFRTISDAASPVGLAKTLSPTMRLAVKAKPSAKLPTPPLNKPQFTLPARPPITSPTQFQTAALAKPEPAPSTSEQPVIACIDDSPVLAHSLKKILVAAGYRVLIIQEPMRGFSELIEHKPSLILLDLQLPNADGYSVCKFLRETPVFKDTPIIILTGQNSSIDRARARLAGASEFLTKPPQPEQLLQMIQQHLATS